MLRLSDYLISPACYYNEHTILTVNGELLQSFTIEQSDNLAEKINLRQSIREAIIKHKAKDIRNISFWFHNVRNKTNINITPHSNYFINKINNSWSEQKKWPERIFGSKVYVTVLIKGFKDNVQSAFSPMYIKQSLVISYCDSYLKQAHDSLNEFVNSFARSLEGYKIKKLGMYVKDNKVLSDHLDMYNTILNFDSDINEIPKDSIGRHILNNNKITFGFNTFQITNKQKKLFGASLVVKNYGNISDNIVGQILQTPCNYVITQSYNSSSGNLFVPSLKRYKTLLDISQSNEIIESFNLDKKLEYDKKNNDAWYETQTIITTTSTDRESLLANIEIIIESFLKAGLTLFRCDLMLEQGFWFQIPGNFNHVSYKEYVSVMDFASFISFGALVTGNIRGGIWGSYISIFDNIYNNPYFFNFHNFNKKQGHSIVVGSRMNKNMLVNFLATQSARLDCKIIFLDFMQSSRALVNTMGGKYLVINKKSSGEKSPGLNLFSLPASAINKKAILSCLGLMLEGQEVSPKHLVKAVDYIMSLPIEKRNMKNFNKILLTVGKNIYDWCGDGTYNGIFDNKVIVNILGNKDLTEKVSSVGIDLTNILDSNICTKVIMRYLLFMLEYEILYNKKRPMMLVINNIVEMQHNIAFTKNISVWLKKMTANNVVVVFVVNSYNDLKNLYLLQDGQEFITNIMLFPCLKASASYKYFSLDTSDVEWLVKNNSVFNVFMLLHEKEKHFLKFEPLLLREHPLLRGGPNVVKAIRDAKKKHGKDPEKWMSFVLGGE